jgi:hypothetical protein
MGKIRVRLFPEKNEEILAGRGKTRLSGRIHVGADFNGGFPSTRHWASIKEMS